MPLFSTFNFLSNLIFLPLKLGLKFSNFFRLLYQIQIAKVRYVNFVWSFLAKLIFWSKVNDLINLLKKSWNLLDFLPNSKHWGIPEHPLQIYFKTLNLSMLNTSNYPNIFADNSHSTAYYPYFLPFHIDWWRRQQDEIKFN